MFVSAAQPILDGVTLLCASKFFVAVAVCEAHRVGHRPYCFEVNVDMKRRCAASYNLICCWFAITAVCMNRAVPSFSLAFHFSLMYFFLFRPRWL